MGAPLRTGVAPVVTELRCAAYRTDEPGGGSLREATGSTLHSGEFGHSPHSFGLEKEPIGIASFLVGFGIRQGGVFLSCIEFGDDFAGFGFEVSSPQLVDLEFLFHAVELSAERLEPIERRDVVIGGAGSQHLACEYILDGVGGKGDLHEFHPPIDVCLDHQVPRPSFEHGHLGFILEYLGEEKPDKAKKELEKAAKRFKEAVDYKPDFPEALNNLGFSLRLTGRYDEALQHYNKAIELRPDFMEAHEYRGRAYLAMDSVQLAKAEYEWLLEQKHVEEAELLKGAIDDWVMAKAEGKQVSAEKLSW